MKIREKCLLKTLIMSLLTLFVLLTEVSASSVNVTLSEYDNKSGIQNEGLPLTLRHEALINSLKSKPELGKYYGGCYIDEEKQLNVVVVGKNQEFLSFCKEILDNDTVYVNGNYSYADLRSIQTELETKLIEKQGMIQNMPETIRKLADRIVSFGISEKENRLVVDIYNLEEEDSEVIKTICSNSNMLRLVNSGIPVLTVSKNPGSGAAIGSLGTYSIGYRACGDTPSGHHEGFVTVAHGGVSIGDTVKFGTTSVGSVFAVNNSNYCDAAFVKLTSGNSVTNTISYSGGSLYPQYRTFFTEGDTIKMAGNASGYIRTGIVKRTSITFSGVFGSNPCYDCLETSYDCASGDSGGIVYQPINGVNYIAGINRGRNWAEYPPGSGYYYYSYAVKAKNIASYLGVVPY